MDLPRWVVRHRGWIALGWAACAVVIVPFGPGLEHRLDVGARVDGSESAAVEHMLATRFGSPFASYAVLVVSNAPPGDSPPGRSLLREITGRVGRARGVTRTFSYLDGGDTLFLGSRATFVIVGLDPGRGASDALIPPLRAVTTSLAATLQPRYPGITLEWTGEAPLNFDLRRTSTRDARRSEWHVLPLMLLMLGLAFGTAVAAVVPVASGMLAIALALGAAALLAAFRPLNLLVENVISMLGLGLGVDYALLTVSRFREAISAGLGPEDAATAAVRHAGHTILLSGLAVAVGFTALLDIPLNELRSIAVGGLIVVAFGVLLATTLLPGVLAWAGAKLERGQLPRALRVSEHAAWWRAWGRVVAARPATVLLAAGIPLVLLSLQARRLDTGMPRGDWLPPDMESSRALHELQRMGDGAVIQSLRVVLELPPGANALQPAGWDATRRLSAYLQHDPDIARVRSLPDLAQGQEPGADVNEEIPASIRRTFVSADGRAALVEALPREGTDAARLAAMVRTLRTVNAEAVTGVHDARLRVGGLPAFNVDYERAVEGRFAYVVALIVCGTLLALGLGFRSVLIPLKAVALNLVSVTAAFGALVLVFQDGHGARLIGLPAPVSGVFPAVPVIVFCIVFGLSMDYEIFLVARVAEARRTGFGESAALVEALATTGGVITSAAAIMIVAFGAFMLGDFLLMKMLGFALAVAVFVDATVVRMAVGPALLRLAGSWNWWPAALLPGERERDAAVRPERVAGDSGDGLDRARQM